MPGISITDFADQMEQIMPEIMRGFSHRMHNDIYKGKITLPQLLILDLLSRQGSSKMTDLAREMKVTTAASTGIVQRLVLLGYVQREFDQNDRRIIKISLSSKGNELLKKLNQQRRELITKIFGQITEHDRSEYLRILMKVKEVIGKEKNN
jgi:MarR family transcriptional regulator, organic hydroperoxide resistance regulator